MNKVSLIFGTHNSQPAGSDDYQFEKAYQEAYKPFLTVLYNHPHIRVVLHYSGVLLEWLEKVHPEFLMLLNEMVKRKQVELLGGGYYDPVLPMIPAHDRIGQIELLTTYIRKHFGKRPRGSWITRQVWEPSLTTTLSTSGMDFTFLEDRQFLEAGCEPDTLHSPYITEDQGKMVNVFPVLSKYHDRIPFENPESVIEKIIEEGPHNGNKIVTIIQEGEYYGLYGDTGKICYSEKWFERFFTLLKESDQIELMRPANLMKNCVPEKRIYFPSTVFSPNGHGNPLSLQSDGKRGNHTVRPSIRQVLSLLPESNLLYSKMIYTNILVNQIRGDKYRKKAAREELWRGQCANAYWHEDSQGIYDNRLRKSAYRALIEAEKITHEKGIFIPSIISVDFDMDGRKEYLFQGNDLSAYVHQRGGTLFELDYLPRGWNYLDTMSRHREFTHNDIIPKSWKADSYMRKAFIDHFFDSAESIDVFEDGTFTEKGSFVDSVYTVEDFNRENKWVNFSCSAAVDNNDVEIRKRYTFKGSTVSVNYDVTNRGGTLLNSVFGSEINLSFASRGMESQRIYNNSKMKTTEIGIDLNSVRDVTDLMIDDVHNKVQIDMNFTNPAELWVLPIETANSGAEALETVYQSTCLVPRWSLSLEPEEVFSVTVTMKFDLPE